MEKKDVSKIFYIFEMHENKQDVKHFINGLLNAELRLQIQI